MSIRNDTIQDLVHDHPQYVAYNKVILERVFHRVLISLTKKEPIMAPVTLVPYLPP